MRKVFTVVCVLYFLALVQDFASAQNNPAVTILSPTSGTVVQPGQTVQIVVAATDVALLTSEAVIGEGSLGTASPQPAAPQLVFSLTVPNTISPGTYQISAVGGLLSGGITNPTQASMVALTVPVQGTVTGFRTGLSPMVFAYPGQQLPLVVTGITSQGYVTLPPASLSIVSANALLASVASNGLVTAQAPGQTQMTIGYSNGANNVSTIVNVIVEGGVRGDLNGDGRVDLNDLDILDSFLNTPANGPNDARDLNHDGVINALDSRILVTLCTRPGCATH